MKAQLISKIEIKKSLLKRANSEREKYYNLACKYPGSDYNRIHYLSLSGRAQRQASAIEKEIYGLEIALKEISDEPKSGWVSAAEYRMGS